MNDLAKTYPQFRQILKQNSGIDLGESKLTLLESRLSRRLSLVNTSTFSDYLSLILKDKNELRYFVELMTTNKTDWFRENQHFDFLSSYLKKELAKKGQQPFMIWSAASSSGEEPYSIAITCEEILRFSGSYRIFATDINTQVLKKGENGIYAKSTILEQVPERQIKSWFKPYDSSTMQIREELREKIKFREFNLIESNLNVPDLQFDCIFLRNVLIYFDQQTIQTVVQRLLRYLKKDGYFIIGHSETLNGMVPQLHHLGRSIYQYRK